MNNTLHIFGLHLWDWIAVGIYLIGITLIGWSTKNTIRTREDFFMAGRRFGKLLMIFHSFGTGTHTDQAVAVAGACHRNGISGIWVQWQWMFTTPFYWLLAPIYRRSRCLTTADMFHERFGTSASVLYVFVSVLSMIINIGVMLQGTGLVISSMTGGTISQTAAILAMTLSFIIYGTAGGLVAAVITDLIQGFFILLLSFLMIPFALIKVGGLAGIRAASPAALNLVSTQSITIPIIALLSVNALIGIVAQSQMMSTSAAGKTEWEGRVGMTYGNFLKRICTLGWALIGVCAIVMYPELNTQIHSENVFGYAIADLLPIGVRGIMLASIMAATMATCNALMVSVSALLTENIYRTHIRPQQTDGHYVAAGRIFNVIVVLIALYFSTTFPSVLEGVFTFFQVTATIGLSFWMGIMWRRMNTTGVYVGFITSALALFITKNYIFLSSVYGSAPAMAYQTAVYIPIGVLCAAIASLLSRSVYADQVDRFFVKIHTPIGQEDKLALSMIEAIPPQQRLVDWGGLLILKPDRQSWMGFLVASVIVLLIIKGTQWLLSW